MLNINMAFCVIGNFGEGSLKALMEMAEAGNITHYTLCPGW